MIITFRCPCNKKLSVKVEHIGKRCACPECGNKSVVPERSSDEPAPRPDEVSRIATTKNPGSALTKRPAARSADEAPRRSRPVADADEAPRKTRPTADEEEAPRRRSATAITAKTSRPPVPSEDTDEEEAPRKRPVTSISTKPRKSPVAAADADDVEDVEEAEEEARPRKRKKKSRREVGGPNKMILVIALAGLAFVLLTGVSIGAWLVFSPSTKSSDQAQVSSPKKDSKDAKDSKPSVPVIVVDEDIKKIPDDAIGFLTMDAAAFWDGEIGKKVLPQIQQAEQPLIDMLGTHFTDYRRFTIIVGPDPEKQTCVVASLRTNLPAEKISSLTGPNAPQIQHMGKSYAKADGGALYIYPDNRTILMGPVEGVHWILTAPPPSDTALLAQARKQATKHLLVGAVNLEAPKIRQGIQSLPADMKNQEFNQMVSNLSQARMATLTLDLGSEIRFHLDLKMPNEKVARDALDEGITLRTIGMKKFNEAKSQMAANQTPQAKQALEQLDSTLQSIKLTQTGDTVNFDLTADAKIGDSMSDFAQIGKAFPVPGPTPIQRPDPIRIQPKTPQPQPQPPKKGK